MVDASPRRLVAMLFEDARAAINLTSAAMQHGEVLARMRAFSKAISIIGRRLQASLGHQHDGGIAVQLNNLYNYILRRLLLTNANNNLTILAEVGVLLVPLQDAWLAVGQTGQPGAVVANSHLSVVS